MKARTEAIQATHEIRPGDVLAGKYKVDRVLGAGGMGMVLAARHQQLDQQVAIKLLLPHSLRNPEIVARFDQEARATVRIQSEHVVKVLDVGKENGTPYMVMEYLQGQDLAGTLKQRGPLPLGDAVGYVLQACEALAEAHKLGIVHRDLKPANLFLTSRADGTPLVKVLDFGISKASLANGMGPQGGLTMDASVMGSPNYMSPEQLKNSKDVDPRADIWSLGLVLYELLTAQVAFQAETLAELHVAILQNLPTPIATRRPDLPQQVELVVLKCLHKDRNFRYSNVAELACDLASFAPPAAQVSVERVCRVMNVAPPSQAAAPSQSSWSTQSPAAGWQQQQPPPSSSWHQQAPASQGYATSTQGYGPAPTGVGWPQPPAPLVMPQTWPQGAPAQAQPLARSGPPAALIALAIIVGVIVLSGLGCVACVVVFG